MNTWDSTKQEKNFKAHGIDFADLESFFDGDLLTREDTRQSYMEQRLQSIGVMYGVPLFVVWTPRGAGQDTPHLISARRAENHEYKAWQNRFKTR